MAEKKQETFTVSDRRMFTDNGDVRDAATEQTVHTSSQAVADAVEEQPVVEQTKEQAEKMPPPPSASEQEKQANAYRETSKTIDRTLEQSGHSPRDMEMNFERFIASLYMTAMMQLGMMREEGGEPRLDPIGARQTIDTISLLGDKTKGNLTSAEQTFMTNALYELRMAYVEVINALSRAPQAPKPGIVT